MKKILVLGAGYYYRQIINQLVEVGFYVLAIDRDPDAPGAKYTHEFEAIDIIDKVSALKFAREKKIDGIMALNDFGTRTASFVSQEMGLVGLPYNVVEAANDKGLMRDNWRNACLAIPRYEVFSSLHEFRNAVDEIGFPCVLKPTDCGGSGRGVSVLRSIEDVEWAFSFARPFVKNARFILEEFLDGTELTIESISVNGNVHILATSDKVKPDIRTRVATSLNYPADFSEDTLNKVEALVAESVLSIGIENGMAHTEVILTCDGPKLVEIGARGGGGHVFHTCIESTSGIRAPVEFAKLLTDERVLIKKINKNGCVYRFFNPPKGILKEVKNLEKIKDLEGLLDIGIVKKPGDKIGFLANSHDRAGFVVTEGKTRNDAVSLADYVENTIQFIVDPLD